jgi:arylsulfatase A-like enzyme
MKNILFIMCDQLRYDYLSCAGHPYLDTPNIDKLASKGVRFTNAYVQSPVCGASRMSFYTGRYVGSHGATWNGVPLKVGEETMGDHLRKLNVTTALIGKTHMKADLEGMARLGIAPDSIIGVRVSECGFDPYERDDGLHPLGIEGRYDPKLPKYEQYLRDKGYNSETPWHDFANSVEVEGKPVSGWYNKYAHLPARVKEEDSETPYMTRRAMAFISETKTPWVAHLSYIKPHWPYIVPAPYHNMYKDVIPAVRDAREKENPHPVYKAFMNHKVGQTFSKPGAREHIIPAYMGLIKQIDDQLGILFKHLDDEGIADQTMIVLTSDHGDYLGDHWLGEKDLFHEQSVKVPLIIYDPSEASNATRGKTCDDLVESIDLTPTFLEFYGQNTADLGHKLEGLSLMPVLHNTLYKKRDYAFSEYHYGQLGAGKALDKNPKDARLFMVFDGRFKYTQALGFRPMLFDLETDPEEYIDLGDDPAFETTRDRLQQALNDWHSRLSQRVTRSENSLIASRGKSLKMGVLIGMWDENDLAPEYQPVIKL